jgi:hypothetical protein
MDPYLEHAGLWPGVHHGLIAGMHEQLNATLPPEFVADVGERVYLIQPDRTRYPDVVVLQTRPRLTPAGGSGSAVLAEPIDTPWFISAMDDAVREPFIQVISATEPERVVTVIEVLSPANKARGSESRRKYLAKQEELLASDVSLLEVDLLLGGDHTVPAPIDYLREQGRWDYLASLHRAGGGWEFQVWPMRIQERLARIAVPLTAGYSDVVLDLQSVFDRTYDTGRYACRVDYSQPPPHPFPTDAAEWAEALLREQGLRA